MNLKSLTNGRTEYKFAVLGYVLGASALTIVLVTALSVSGTAAETEFDSGELEDENDSVTADVMWNDSISDPANTTAEVTVYEASDYDENGTNASAISSTTLDADPGNTTTAEFDTSGSLEAGTEYVMVVSGDDAAIEDVEFSGTGGGAIFASEGQRNMAIVVVAIIAVALFAKAEE